MSPDALLAELRDVDRQLAECGSPAPFDHRNAERLLELLARRVALVAQTPELFDPWHPPTREQRERLRQSEQEGNTLLRQLMAARHGVLEDLARVRQEQRLWDALHSSGLQEAETAQCVDING